MPYGSVLNVNINDNNTCTIGIFALFQTQKVPECTYTCGMRVIIITRHATLDEKALKCGARVTAHF